MILRIMFMEQALSVYRWMSSWGAGALGSVNAMWMALSSGYGVGGAFAVGVYAYGGAILLYVHWGSDALLLVFDLNA